LLSSLLATNADAPARPLQGIVPSSTADARQALYAFNALELMPWDRNPHWRAHEVDVRLERFSYLYGIEDAAHLAVLPVPDREGAPGFPRAGAETGQRAAQISSTSAIEDACFIGLMASSGARDVPVSLPLSALNRHVLVVGSPGAGKTTTVHRLLCDLWQQHQIPFLVMESSKREYRNLIEVLGDDLNVFTIGRNDLTPLRLNPLRPQPGVRCQTQISRVMASLKMSLPLFPPLPQLLEEAVILSYRSLGWNDGTVLEDGLTVPTIRKYLIDTPIAARHGIWVRR
jgi:hypothetical protein